MLRHLFFAAMLMSSALAEYQSSYASYNSQSPQPSYQQPSHHQSSYETPNYGYTTGNSFYAPPAQPFFPSVGLGVNWGLALSVGLGLLVVMLLIGGAFLATDFLSNYYYDFDSDLAFRTLSGLPVPEISQVISGIEKLQDLYEAATTKTLA